MPSKEETNGDLAVAKATPGSGATNDQPGNARGTPQDLVERVFGGDEAAHKSAVITTKSTAKDLVERVFGGDDEPRQTDLHVQVGTAVLSRGSAVLPTATPGAFHQGPSENNVATTTTNEVPDDPEDTNRNDAILEQLETGNTQDSSGLAVANPIEESSNYFDTTPVEATEYVPLSEEERKAQEWNRKKAVGIRLALLMLILALVIVWIAWMVGAFGKDDSGAGEDALSSPVSTTESPSFPPTKAPLVLTLPWFTVKAIEQNPDSPQSKAYEWLLRDTMFPSASYNQRLQRFALATFYYAANGEDWFINGD